MDAFCGKKIPTIHHCPHAHTSPPTLLLGLFDRQKCKQEMTTVNISWQRGQSRPSLVGSGASTCWGSKFNRTDLRAAEVDGWICDRKWKQRPSLWVRILILGWWWTESQAGFYHFLLLILKGGIKTGGSLQQGLRGRHMHMNSIFYVSFHAIHTLELQPETLQTSAVCAVMCLLSSRRHTWT